MQGSLAEDLLSSSLRGVGFAESEFERRGTRLDFGAPVTASAAASDSVAVAFGDGTVRFFRPGLAPVTVEAHRGVVLCMAADGNHVLTGGDDGRFLRISPEADIEEIASFGTRWVDCVAAGPGHRACSSGRIAHIRQAGKTWAAELEHASTVGGLAFDAKGNRLAVTHYGGATVWERGKRRWKPSRYVWKGSHGAVSFSPNGKFVITSMQENALHGWRLRDKRHFAMAGYPAKIKSLAWVGDTPYLATSGAEETVCWPFDGPVGPQGRSAMCIAHAGADLVSHVHALPGQPAVFTGFRDGAVLLSELDDMKDAIVIRGSTGAEVTAITVSPTNTHMLVGDAKGHVLWAPLGAGDAHARTV